jgi:hypothetical protein
MATTYYLGAGASANTIPCVADLASKILEISDYIEKFGVANKTIQMYTDDPVKTRNLTVDKNACKTILTQFCTNLDRELSIDTLAKIYYRQNRLDDYIQLKAILLASFLIWTRQKGIDKRYNNFWATLMQVKKSSSNSDIVLEGYGNNINIVSWNYDTQLEDSLLWIYDGSRIGPSYYAGNEKSSIVSSNTGIPYIKLNGSASFKTNCTFRNGEFSFSLEKIPDSWLAHLASSIITHPSDYTRDIESIKFCWERNDYDKQEIELFKKHTEKTTTLVVIGYTFPSINHLVDTEIIQSMNLLKKVYFQGADKYDSERIKDYFSAVSNNTRNTELLAIDAKGFFIPPEATLAAKPDTRMSSLINF